MRFNAMLMVPAAFVGFAVVAALAVSLSLISRDGDDVSPSTTVLSETVDDTRPANKVEPRSPQKVLNGRTVRRDAEFQSALRSAGFSTDGWKTDFGLYTIPFGDITRVLPRDGVPALDDPNFVDPQEAEAWLGENEPVIFLEINGEAKAYPLQILIWHEIVNDVLGGVPVMVSFCPLCNSAIAFDRRIDDVVYDFGVSGNLRHSDLIMYDRSTHTWWQQFTGEGIVGEFAGRTLEILPSSIISLGAFKAANPEGAVLSQDTGFERPYGDNPYAGYDRADRPPFLFDGDTDERLSPKERVVAVTVGTVDVAFPLTILSKEQVINYGIDGQNLVVFFKSGTTSALDSAYMKISRDVGATGVFDPKIDGQKLTFRIDGDDIVDNETGSVWNILGKAVDGPLRGKELTWIIHGDHFWFAWAAFKPNTIIYTGVR